MTTNPPPDIFIDGIKRVNLVPPDIIVDGIEADAVANKQSLVGARETSAAAVRTTNHQATDVESSDVHRRYQTWITDQKASILMDLK